MKRIEKYNVKKLLNNMFIEKLLKRFNEKVYNKKYIYAKELYEDYINQNSKVDINNFLLRSDI